MRFAEINKKFTEVVAGYTAAGFTFNLATMGGSQGEIAKVDLTNGEVIVRVVLDRMSGIEHEEDSEFYLERDGVELVVMLADEEVMEDRVKPNSNNDWGTLWTNKCKVLHKEEFFLAGRREGNWYISREEAVEAQKRRIERYKRADAVGTTVIEKQITMSEDLAKKMLAYARRQPKCGRAKMANLRVTCESTTRGGMVVKKAFYVHTKSHTFQLG